MNSGILRHHKRTSWRFSDLIPGTPPAEFWVSGVPETSVVKRTVPGLGVCFFKMEHTCPTGSHKDRAAVFQVSVARAEEVSGVVIPSSGNAAIAVAAAGAECRLPVYAFISPKTHPGKLNALLQFDPYIIMCDQPVNRARNTARRFGFRNLRPSRDENAVKGFMSLGYELAETFEEERFSSIFTFTTSGATLTGIARAFRALLQNSRISCIPELHAVQSGNATDIAACFDHVPKADSITGDTPGFGGVKQSPLCPELFDHVRMSGGRGWFAAVSDADTMNQCLLSLDIETSLEGCCALAAAIRWRKSGGTGIPMVILTGKKYSETLTGNELHHSRICHADTYGHIERCIKRWRNG
jgi:threonine synthase